MTRKTTGGGTFNSSARLPLVAGWDHLLPAWFTRLHPRHKTPVGSIAFIGAAVLVLAVASSLGTGNQEAFQLLSNASGIAYGLAYLVMFAIPLVSAGERRAQRRLPGASQRASWTLRLASMSGFAMTLLFVVLSVFPIIDVPHPALFALKIGGVVAGLNAAAALLYWRAQIRRTRELG